MSKNKRYYWLGHNEASEQDRFFLEALDKDLWEAGSAEQWDTCWYTGMPDRDVFEDLDASKSINHIPGNNVLTIKSNLYETLINAKHRLAGSEAAKRFDFFPETFSMPEDYTHFLETAKAEPEQMWIKKPKNLSRGRGIDMVRHPTTVPFDSEWIMQRYLGNPHLCQGRKYVLRCYVLITSVEPLRVYWYQDGFAKLASEAYSTEDLHNLYRHLTNPDINEQNEEAETAVTFISFEKYGQWLRSEGHDDKHFFKQLKELITLTAIAAREAMRKRCNGIDANTNGCYELIGLDCMVDNNIKPWIIECNLSPSLSTYADPDAGADDEVIAKRNMVRDMVNLLGLNNPVSDIPVTPQAKAQQEFQQRGEFELLFPSTNANEYFNTFPIPRYTDIEQAQTLSQVTLDEGQLQLQPHSHSDFAFNNSIALFAQKLSGNANHQADSKTECLTPNELASWIWLNNAENISPTDLIQQLAQTLPEASTADQQAMTQQLATQVWDVLADWSHANVFAEISSNPATLPEAPNTYSTHYLPLGEHYLCIHSFCPMADHYFQEAGNAAITSQQPKGDALLSIDLITGTHGYSLIYQRNQTKHYLKLSQLLPALYQLAMEKLTQKDQALLIPGCLIQQGDSTSLVVCEDDELLDSMVFELSTQHQWQAQGHYCFLNDGKLTAQQLPARITELAQSNHSWAIAENNHQAIFSYENWPHPLSTKNITVDQVIIIEQQNDDTLTSSTDNLHASALKSLWQLMHHSDTASVALLAQWMNTIEHTHLISHQKESATQLAAQLKNIISNEEDAPLQNQTMAETA